MLMLTLRFDGSFRGGSGGAGAVLTVNNGGSSSSSSSSGAGAVVWQGARFLRDCPNSAAAEYEGLLLGLDAALRERPTDLRIEGDCRLVLTQAAGTARPRKQRKQHKLVAAKLESLAPHLTTRPCFESISRDENAHADALSREAVAAMEALHSGAILGAARAGRTSLALTTLERSARENVRLAPAVYDELMRACRARSEWRTLLSVYAAAQRDPVRRSDEAYGHAIAACEALGASARGSDPPSRQLSELLRQRGALDKQRRRAAAVAATRAEVADGLTARAAAREAAGEAAGGVAPAVATSTLAAAAAAAAVDDDDGHHHHHDDDEDDDGVGVHAAAADERGAAARAWRSVLEAEAGSAQALEGDVPGEEVGRLLALADRLAAEGGLGLLGAHAARVADDGPGGGGGAAGGDVKAFLVLPRGVRDT
jgi:ribonuclease HI